MVALKLAAFDLMNIDQTRSYAETIGISHRIPTIPRAWVETIRLELLR
jgi:hypothetical protein